MYAKGRGYCVTGRCYNSSHIPIEVCVLILWLVHTATTPSVSVAIPFCPKDLVPFAGAPVQLPKCWIWSLCVEGQPTFSAVHKSEGRLQGGGNFTDGMKAVLERGATDFRES